MVQLATAPGGRRGAKDSSPRRGLSPETRNGKRSVAAALEQWWCPWCLWCPAAVILGW